MTINLNIKPLTRDLATDYLRFFDWDAFPVGAEWASCYCCFYHCSMSDSEWDERSGDLNRETVSALIDQGQHHGLLAYDNNRVIGWCHTAPRHTLGRLVQMLKDQGYDTSDEHVGSVICFVIAPPYRGRGVARQLLASCNRFMKDQGMTSIEAYPPKGNPRIAHYHGSQSMYLSSGYTTVAMLDEYTVMRAAL